MMMHQCRFMEPAIPFGASSLQLRYKVHSWNWTHIGNKVIWHALHWQIGWTKDTLITETFTKTFFWKLQRWTKSVGESSLPGSFHNSGYTYMINSQIIRINIHRATFGTHQSLKQSFDWWLTYCTRERKMYMEKQQMRKSRNANTDCWKRSTNVLPRYLRCDQVTIASCKKTKKISLNLPRLII